MYDPLWDSIFLLYWQLGSNSVIVLKPFEWSEESSCQKAFSLPPAHPSDTRCPQRDKGFNFFRMSYVIYFLNFGSLNKFFFSLFRCHFFPTGLNTIHSPYIHNRYNFFTQRSSRPQGYFARRAKRALSSSDFKKISVKEDLNFRRAVGGSPGTESQSAFLTNTRQRFSITRIPKTASKLSP